MKRKLAACAVVMAVSAGISLFGLTYDNNEYQRKSRAYSELAVKAFDDGDYDTAAEYARMSDENAGLSAAYIEKMLARSDAETTLYKAHTRLAWAKDIKAEKYFPAAFQSASDDVSSGDGFFSSEDYASAKAKAESALDALSAVREVTPLPAFYKVEKWLSTRDCLWNIAKNPAVYGNPLLWEELYKANKGGLKRPADPNLLAPGMVVTIPSISGEFREGTYDPSITYEPFKNLKKK